MRKRKIKITKWNQYWLQTVKFLNNSEIRLKILVDLFDGPLKIRELNKNSLLSYSSISSNVHRLIEQGYVEKIHNSFRLTNLGLIYITILMDFHDVISTVSDFSDFWLDHDIEALSINNLNKLSALDGAQLIRCNSTDIYRTHKEFKRLFKDSNFLKVIWLDIIKIIYRNIAHLNSNHPEWLTNFLRTIASPEHLTKPISELRELTFYSYRHLNRLFKEYMGETLHDYVSALKMNYGATLLRTTDMGILEISSACAYDSLSHFIKMFKRHFKMTPKEYRRSFKYFPEKGI